MKSLHVKLDSCNCADLFKALLKFLCDRQGCTQQDYSSLTRFFKTLKYWRHNIHGFREWSEPYTKFLFLQSSQCKIKLHSLASESLFRGTWAVTLHLGVYNDPLLLSGKGYVQDMKLALPWFSWGLGRHWQVCERQTSHTYTKWWVTSPLCSISVASDKSQHSLFFV